MKQNFSIQARVLTVLHLISPSHYQLPQPTDSSLSTSSSDLGPVTKIRFLFLSLVHRIKTRIINQLKSTISNSLQFLCFCIMQNGNSGSFCKLWLPQKNNPWLKISSKNSKGNWVAFGKVSKPSQQGSPRHWHYHFMAFWAKGNVPLLLRHSSANFKPPAEVDLSWHEPKRLRCENSASWGLHLLPTC